MPATHRRRNLMCRSSPDNSRRVGQGVETGEVGNSCSETEVTPSVNVVVLLRKAATMTWKVLDTMSQKREFVELARAEGANVSELCRRFGVSRKMGYKWLHRVQEHGLDGLQARSSRPLTMPVKTLDAVERFVLDVREQHPAWGGRKIKARLRALGHINLPAASTITEILRRHGKLSAAATQVRQAAQRFERSTPNELWQIDFKGQFPMTNQQDCYPLTILDDHSRYVVCLSACTEPDHDTVKDRLTAVFSGTGCLKRCIRTTVRPGDR